MRLLLISHGMYPFSSPGGVELYTSETAQLLATKHSLTVLLFTSDHEEAFSREKIGDNIAVKVVPGSTSIYPHRGFGLDDFRYFLHTIEPELVYIISSYLFPLRMVEKLYSLNIPWIVYLHDFYLLCQRIKLLKRNNEPCAGPQAFRCTRCLFKTSHLLRSLAHLTGFRARMRSGRLILNNAGKILCGSEYVARYFSSQLKIAKERFTIIPPILKLEKSSTSASRNSGILRIGFFSGISQSKGAHILDKALTLVDCPWQLTVYNMKKKNLRKSQLFREHKRPIIFNEAFLPEELRGVLESLDVIVTPSIGPETYCRIIDEACARGVIVVASDTGGMTERIRDGENCFVVKAGDADALAKKITDIYNHFDTLRSSMKFDLTLPDIDGYAEKLFTIISAVASGQSRPWVNL